MDIYKIMISLLDNPFAPKFYRELRDYYAKTGKINESLAFDHLIEQKFGKNVTIDHSHDN